VLSFSSIRRFDVPQRAPHALNLCRVLLLAALLWPAPGNAQPVAPGEAGADPQARARFEQGVAAFDEGRFREAVELFKEADRLAPSPLHSFNVAKVYERMGDNRSALASFREYLRRLPGAPNLADVRRRVAELEQALKALGVQQLSVLSAPAGATVLVDDVTRGVTPWTGELPPGRHLLALRLGGYRDKVSEIELPADRAIDVELTLQRSAPETAPAAQAGAAADPAARRPAADVIAPARALPTAEEPAPVPRWWTWAMFGGSAAALVGAGAFELRRANLEDAARESTVQTESLDKYEAMERHQKAARICLGVGLVAAVASGVSLFFDVRHASEAPTDLAFGCDSDGCSLAAGGRF
jgi:hypothetical protein